MADIITPIFMSWVWVAAAAFSIMTAFIALVYALGSILLNEKMKTWAKMELVEVFYSAIIISAALGAIPVIDGVVQGSLGVSNLGDGEHPITQWWVRDSEAGLKEEEFVDICGEDMVRAEYSVYQNLTSCHVRLATYYLRTIFGEARDFAYMIYRSYIWSSMASEFSINVESAFEQAGFFTWTPWRGFFTMGNVIKELSFDWAMKIMQLTKFQELLVRFTATALFPGLFITGAILRTLVFTRRLGGLLLAIGIALYFVFTSFYSFGALIMLHLKFVAAPAWEVSDANKHGTNDPPIMNTIYVTGDIPMPGGTVTDAEMEAQYLYFDTMSEEEFADYVEGEGFAPDIDLGKQLSEAEKEEAFETSQEGFSTWFGDVSRQSMIDKVAGVLGPSYWRSNGFLDVLARLVFFSLFFSLFGIIGTIAAIRSLAMTFGGDIEIAGLTRLI